MKKWVSLIVATVLIIVSAVLVGKNDSAVIGKGTGEDEQINNLTELSELFNSLSFDALNDSLDNEKYTLSVKNMRSAAAESDDQKEPELNVDNSKNKKYSSVTFSADGIARFTNSSSQKISQENGTSTRTSNGSVKMERQMKAYFSNEAAFYAAKAFIYNNSYERYSLHQNFQEANSSATTSIEEEIYISKSNCFLRFKTFNTVSNYSYKCDDSSKNETHRKAVFMPTEFLNKWIDFSVSEDAGNVAEQVNALFSQINNLNISILKCFAKYMEQNDDIKMFSKSDEIYTANKNTVESLLSDLFSEVFNVVIDLKLDGNVEIDLTNRFVPKLFLKYSSADDNDNNSSQTSNSVSSNLSVFEQENYSFRNINNTVVGMPSMTEFISFEEINTFFEENN